jgi:hypothetical protein
MSVCRALGGQKTVDYRRRRKPVGGFLFLTVTQLSMAWWAYQERFIQLKDLRVWFAAHELVARRCGLKDNQKPHYGIEELRRLVAGRGGEEDSLRRLERVGLLTWSSSHITFARGPEDLHLSDLLSLQEMLSRIQNTQRKVPVPRQIVRFIAAPSKRCVIATILGHLFRCLYYRVGECVSGGFCKASWVSKVFEVDVRNVKAARKFLAETLGFLESMPTPQSLLNRFGTKTFINLSWDGSAVEKSPDKESGLPPLLAEIDTGLPPLEEHRKPLQEPKHQKPAMRGKSPGIFKTKGGETPQLKHIEPEDLRDTIRLLTLFEEAQREGLTGGSDSERLTFVATAERARLTATSNAPGLFAQLVRRRLWHFVTQDDEDRAQKRLREYFYGDRGERKEPVRTRHALPLSQDALFVAEVSMQLRRKGFMGDVFAAVSRELPEWTRERWENAMKKLSAAKEEHAGERGLNRIGDLRVSQRC